MADEAVKVEAAQPDVAAPVEAVAEAAPATNDTAESKPEEASTNVDSVIGEVKEDEKKQVEEPAAEVEGAKDEKAVSPKKEHTSKPRARKYDPSVLPKTDDPAQIRSQVEFYFGDSNLPQDKFMWEQTGGWENRPVKLKKICTFGRMRRFEPYEAIVAALKESQFLNVSGPEGDEELTRKTAYVSNSKPYAKKEAATVYIKGFGEEEPDTQFKIEAMLAQCGQTVRSIRLRRTEEDVFKGSVFVEFDDEEQATAFLALDPKPQFEGNDLKIMSKKDYVEEKNQLIKEGKMEPSKSRKVRFWEGKEIGGSRDNFHGRGRGRGRGDFRGSRTDSDDWKKRREEDQQNGFRRNDRDSRGRGRGRGRGGRGGRGRGGRDNNRRDDRDGRSNRNTNDIKRPTIKATNENGEVVKGGETNGKRARDADGDATGERPAKKADTKADAAATEA